MRQCSKLGVINEIVDWTFMIGYLHDFGAEWVCTKFLSKYEQVSAQNLNN